MDVKSIYYNLFQVVYNIMWSVRRTSLNFDVLVPVKIIPRGYV